MMIFKKTNYPVLITLLLVLVFFVVQPRTQHILFPITQQTALNSFVGNIERSHDVDLAAYWQFRDFYSPGSIRYDKKGLAENSNQIIPFVKNLQVTPQLLFTSSKITSVAGRTKDQTIPVVLGKNHILFASKSVVLTEDINEFSLIFLKPVSEMKKVNGFLEHDTSSDDKSGSMWLEYTVIKKN